MSETQRDTIVRAAAAAFHRGGYASTGLAQVCADAGVSRAQLRRVFDSKRDLGVAVIEHFVAERRALLDRAFRDGIPVRGQVQRMFSLLHREQVDAKQRWGTTPGSPLAVFGVGDDDDGPLRSAIDVAFDRWRACVSEALRAADGRGEIRLPDPSYPAVAVVAFAEGALALARASDDPEVIIQLAPASMSLLIDRKATGSWPLILLSSGSFPTVG